MPWVRASLDEARLGGVEELVARLRYSRLIDAKLPGNNALDESNLVKIEGQGVALPLLPPQGHRGSVRALAPLEGGWLASGGIDGTVRIWEVKTSQEVQVLEGHRGSVLALAPLEGGWLASGGRDGTVRIWEVETGREVRVLEGHQDWVLALAPLEGGWLASGGSNGTVRIWEVGTGREVRVLEGHQDWVNALAPLEGGWLASGGEGGTVRIWEVETGKLAFAALVLTGELAQVVVRLDKDG
ncbi:WD40 repeat domain-containing protein, partial [Oceanithermus sp.]